MDLPSFDDERFCRRGDAMNSGTPQVLVLDVALLETWNGDEWQEPAGRIA